MLKMRKTALSLTAPFRNFRHIAGEWIKNSNSMPADFIRRRNIDKVQQQVRSSRGLI